MKQDAPSIDAPFPGLRPFERHEDAIFFGRGSHTTTMLRWLRKQNFLAVVGSSGCGKSSLVRAGLLPAVADGCLNGQTNWRFVIVRPGDVLSSKVDPFANLAAQLLTSLQPKLTHSDLATEMLAYREATLRIGPNGLLDAIRDSLVGENSRHVFVLVDQFEEIFRYRDNSLSRAQQRQQQNDAVAFVDLLLSTAQARDPRVFVSLTMRSDFLGDCDAFHGLPEAINSSQFLTPRLTRDELRDVIELPLQVEPLRGSIDPQVTAELLNAIGDSQDLLPQLQHVLRLMWAMAAPKGESDSNTSHHIAPHHYYKSGGLSDALNQHATFLYKPLPPVQQRIAQRLFRCLSERNPKGQLIRRVTSVQEVSDVADVAPQEVIDAVEVFRQPGVHFLVTSPAGTLTAATSIDISHEILLRQWGKMGEWIESENAAATRYRRLRETIRLKSRLVGTELLDVWRWRRIDNPTARWAQRYGGQFKDCMDLLRKSFIRSALVSTALVTLVIVAPFLITMVFENQELKTKQEQLEAQQAATILAFIVSGADYPTPEEFVAYGELAEASEEIRLSFLNQLLDATNEQSRAQYTFALHAVIGLDTDTRNKVRRILIENGTAPKDKERELNIACVMLGTLLEIEGDRKLGEMIAANLAAALQKTSDPESVAEILNRFVELNGRLTGSQTQPLLAAFTMVLTNAFETENSSPLVKDHVQAVASLGEKLPGEQVLALAQQILAAMEMTTESDALSALGKALGNLAEKLPEEQVLALAQQILAAMERTSDYSQLSSLGSALGSLAEKLPGEQALVLAQQILAAMEMTTESDALSFLASALGSLAEKLPGDQALAFAQKIVAAMEMTTESDALFDLGSALRSVAEKLSEKQALVLAQQIVAATEKMTDSLALSSFGNALGSLGERLLGEQALAFAQLIAAATEKTTDSLTLSSLGSALGSLAEELPEDTALAFAQEIVAAMEMTTESFALFDLGSALGSVAERLSGKQALAFAQQIVAAMEETTDSLALSSLGTALGRLGEELPGEQALAFAQQIVAATEKTTNSLALSSLGTALGSLGEELPEDQALAFAQQIVTTMEMTTDSLALSSLGLALGSLAENLPSPQALAGAQRIVAAMKEATASYALSSLGSALASLGQELPGQQTLAGIQQILAAMERTSDYSQLSSLGSALASLAENVPGEQALVLAQQILAAMEMTTESDALPSLASALSSLGEKLPGQQTLALAHQIVTAMKETNDSSRLSSLSSTLSSLSEKLSEEQTFAAAQQIVAAMEMTTESDALSSLASALSSLSEKLPGQQTLAGVQQILVTMGNRPDSLALSPLGKAFTALAARIEAKDMPLILKSIVCVGETRKGVLTGLEKKTGKQFDGNLWKAVKWLEEQGIDVKNDPRTKTSQTHTGRNLVPGQRSRSSAR